MSNTLKASKSDFHAPGSRDVYFYAKRATHEQSRSFPHEDPFQAPACLIPPGQLKSAHDPRMGGGRITDGTRSRAGARAYRAPPSAPDPLRRAPRRPLLVPGISRSRRLHARSLLIVLCLPPLITKAIAETKQNDLQRRGWGWPSGIVNKDQDRRAWLCSCIVLAKGFGTFATGCGAVPRRVPQGARGSP